MKTFFISLIAVIIAVGATFYVTSSDELAFPSELPFELPWAAEQEEVETVSLPSYQPGDIAAEGEGSADITERSAPAEESSVAATTADSSESAMETAESSVSGSADTGATNTSDSALTTTGSAAAPVSSAPNSAPSRAASATSLVGATYNGEITAEQQVSVMAEVSGQVLDVTVEVGDRIEAGGLLVTVDATTLEAQREQALAGLIAAQSQLDLLLTDPDAAAVEAARAGVNAAAASYQRAVDGASEEDLELALAQVRQAEAAVRSARASYNQVRGNPNIGMLPQSLQLEQATISLEAAQIQYDQAAGGATNDAIAGAYAQLASARSQLEQLQKGPEAAQIRATEAQVRQAETSLYLTQVQLDKATVEAPIDGVVAQLQATTGGMAAPGSPLLVIQSNNVKITIPVEENRLSQLTIGQPATLRVSAYPDRVFEAEVTNIAPSINTANRTVAVTIRPLESAPELLPGMSATITLE